ncbi:hypothetical protein [Streptomyces sp. NPDC048577]|uniref:hypothetical protein n=1 Tax=Streptomyces sp. NPDC048577 TaxID=3157209 RepID=UPI00344694F7
MTENAPEAVVEVPLTLTSTISPRATGPGHFLLIEVPSWPQGSDTPPDRSPAALVIITLWVGASVCYP